MNFLLKEKRPALAILVLTLLHLPFIFLPSLNLEFAFAGAAQYFQTGEQALLNQYFHFQANTLAFPFLISLIAKLFHSNNYLLIGRLLSLVGSVGFAISLLKLMESLMLSSKTQYVSILLLNPLVWVFSSRATADLLPAALATLAISLLISSSANYTVIVAAAVVMGFAGLLKYHVLATLVLVLMFAVFDSAKSLSLYKAFIFIAIPLAMLGLYLTFIYSKFGFWFTPPNQQEFLTGSQPFLNNLVLYAGYLSLLCIPISLFSWKLNLAKRNIVLSAFGFIFFFVVGFLFLNAVGETNLGPFDRFVDQRFFNGLFVVFAVSAFGSAFSAAAEMKTLRQRRQLFFILSVSLVLCAFSFSRPAQRYLLVLMPLFFVAQSQQKISYFKTLPFLFLFMAMNIFTGYSQWCKGGAAAEMASKVAVIGLLDRTDPGPIVWHVGDRFRNRVDEPGFAVVQGHRPDALLTVSRGFRFASVKYSLVSSGTESP